MKYLRYNCIWIFILWCTVSMDLKKRVDFHDVPLNMIIDITRGGNKRLFQEMRLISPNLGKLSNWKNFTIYLLLNIHCIGQSSEAS